MKKNFDVPHNSETYFQLIYPKIIETIRLSASEPEIQIDAFPKEEFPPEEIGYLVEHALIMATELEKFGFISKSQLDSLAVINHHYDALDKSNWSIEGLMKSKDWEKIRILSAQSLNSFDVAYAEPNLYWCNITDIY